jgi:hypothetical protein
MQTPRQAPSSADVAAEVTSLSGGLGILMVPLFPLALPGLLLFVIAPLALVAVVGVLVATPVVLPVWLTRIVLRSRSRRRSRVSQPAMRSALSGRLDDQLQQSS